MDSELLKYFTSLGVGGILAGVMFLIYRRDMKEVLKTSEERNDKLMEMIEKSVTALTENSVILERLHESKV